jgi:two-component system chemotaxis response regulator CheB
MNKPAIVGQGSAAGKIVAIGASSGGPNALRYLLPRIPADLHAGIVIVQHMPESFTRMLAQWLSEICELEVKEAEPGDLAVPGKAFIAPGSSHMKVRKTAAGCQILLEGSPLVNGHRPSVDVLFRSVAEEYGDSATGIIMTGMGSDGTQGLEEIKAAGGWTIAQDEETCAVYGMPRIAVERGCVNEVVSLRDMATYLTLKIGRAENSYAIS